MEDALWIGVTLSEGGSAIPNFPVQITYRNVAPSATIDASVMEKAEKLGVFYDRIMSCRVILEAPHRHHQKGKLYHIRINLAVPGGEVTVKHEPKRIVGSLALRQKIPEVALTATREPSKYSAHGDIYVALRDAFDAARRKLQDYARARRGAVKVHEPLADGRVTRLFKEEGFGFLEGHDGREIYFHKNSVLEPGFSRLRVGNKVFFVEEQGKRGPQASTVRVSGR